MRLQVIRADNGVILLYDQPDRRTATPPLGEVLGWTELTILDDHGVEKLRGNAPPKAPPKTPPNPTGSFIP